MAAIQVLRDNEIDDDDIADLSKADLKELGLKMAQVLRILKASKTFWVIDIYLQNQNDNMLV